LIDGRSESEAAETIRGLSFAARLLGIVACVFLFAMMALTFVDVIGRYFFLTPVPAAYEIVSLMMPAVIFCALPLTVLREGHVTVDLLDSFFGRSFARAQAVVVNVLSALALGLLVWRLGVKTIDDFQYETTTDELWIQIWPFGAGMSFLCAVAALAALANAVQYAMGTRQREAA
jgi:TRAP-type C4-dicarboxylate transport system permease small subunit